MRTSSVLRLLLRLLPIVGISLLSSSVFAQAPQRQPRRIEDFKPSAFDCHHVTQGATDPVSSRLAQVFDCYSGGLIAVGTQQSRWGLLWSQISCVEGRRSIRMREPGVEIGNSG